MTIHLPSRSPEWISSLTLGLVAGVTSTVLTAWAPLSDLGRGIVFVGSALSGTALAYWASRASGAAMAVFKSAVSGAIQANMSATALFILAVKIDEALRLSPKHAPPGDLGPFALIILIVGSIVGLGVGVAYSVVPALVAHWRKKPSIANHDRAMFASAGFAAVAAVVHALIVSAWEVWLPVAILAFALAVTAMIRTSLRTAFLARVRAGREPHYRIEHDETGNVLYRVAPEAPESTYREAATPQPEPEALARL